MKRIGLFLSTLLAIASARGQVSPTGGLISLYELDQTQGKFVLSLSFESSKDVKGSFVVIGDTFAVKSIGSACLVTMSNAYVLQTKFGPSPTNAPEQMKMQFDVYAIPFPRQTKIVFNGSVVELPKWKIDGSSVGGVTTYEGDDALRQMKKMGIEPPPDMDLKKASGGTQKDRQ